MASNYTSNYNLCQWAASDKVLRTEFNADNAKIDAAIKAVDGRVSAVDVKKADQASVTALEQSVNKKLELRNCQVVAGSYTGTGKYGPENPNTLTFPRKLLYLLVSGGTVSALHMPHGLPIAQVHSGTTNGVIYITWGERSVSWYVTSGNSTHAPSLQMNSTGTHYYIALLELD